MAIERLFPTLIYQKNWKGSQKLIEALIRESYQLKEMDEAGRRWCKKNYPEGYTSYGSISDLHRRSSNFEKLKKWIDQQVVVYCKSLDLDLHDGKIQMTSCWVNIMGKHSYHAFHLHPASTISGTFYLKVPAHSGAIKFEDPRLAGFMASPPRLSKAKKENQRFVSIGTKSGDLLLFESWLKHEVVVNRSQQDRLSVSFNYDWIR